MKVECDLIQLLLQGKCVRRPERLQQIVLVSFGNLVWISANRLVQNRRVVNQLVCDVSRNATNLFLRLVEVNMEQYVVLVLRISHRVDLLLIVCQIVDIAQHWLVNLFQLEITVCDLL